MRQRYSVTSDQIVWNRQPRLSSFQRVFLFVVFYSWAVRANIKINLNFASDFLSKQMKQKAIHQSVNCWLSGNFCT